MKKYVYAQSLLPPGATPPCYTCQGRIGAGDRGALVWRLPNGKVHGEPARVCRHCEAKLRHDGQDVISVTEVGARPRDPKISPDWSRRRHGGRQ